ncbi:MAG: alpha/beta family hydrolase, partial [Nitrososphaerales archaeon]
LAEHFSANGVTVLRCDLPFRQKHPHGPPSPASAVHDQQGLRRAAELLKSQVSGRLFLGGSSYGGRQASLLLASDRCAGGLLLLSYPLHPPGKASQLRTAHFPKLNVPTLFVSGTRDPFGSPEELVSAVQAIPASHRIVHIDGAGHDLWPKAKRAEIPALVWEGFFNFLIGADR